MHSIVRLLRLILVVVTVISCAQSYAEVLPVKQNHKVSSLPSPPNILLIVADDLGYAELGAYGSEIETPAIDELANNGVRFTNFYAHSNCSPTRAMLLSGIDSHLVGLGAMYLALSPNQKGQPGYEGYLNFQSVAVSTLLQDAGYRTFVTGKWHLGHTEQTLPAARGFDRYFIQSGGAPPDGHFNLNGAKPESKGAYFEDGQDRTGSDVPDDFFSSNFYTDKLIDYLESDSKSNAPFFAYLAFSAPHIPVQAPASHIDQYRGRYDEGYDLARQSRFERMKRMGLVNDDVSLARRAPTVTPWEQLSPQEQRIQSRLMEVYAGAVTNMDDNVGRLLDYLRDSGQLENTLVLFLSDNGAAGFNGWQSERLIQRYQAADNRYENIGRDGSLLYYGPGWGSAGSTPFYLFKRHMAEGGIRVPFIVSGPGVEHKGAIRHEVLTVRDIAPTLLEIAGTSYPEDEYQGRTILPQSGRTFVKVLADERKRIHGPEEVFGWELFKRRAVRKGQWKLLWLEPPFGFGRWQLFNINDDPGESIDLAKDRPEKLIEMINAWDKYKRENNVIIGDGPLLLP